jgi:hypothetical protein
MTSSRFKPANPYLHTEANERMAKLSSNGKWLATVNGGGKPVWSRDGKELYFIGADQKMMAAAVKGGDQLRRACQSPYLARRSRPLPQTVVISMLARMVAS